MRFDSSCSACWVLLEDEHALLHLCPCLSACPPSSAPTGFADWLRLQLARVQQGLPAATALLLPDEAAALEGVAVGHVPAGEPYQQDAAASVSSSGSSGGSPPADQQQQRRAAALLGWALADDNWLHSSRLEIAVQQPLLRLAAHYLLRERRRWAALRAGSPPACLTECASPAQRKAAFSLAQNCSPKRRGLALDPVANFHLRNGASVLQLNWRADGSEAGLARSHGVMVNYQYELDRLADNNRAYLVDGRVSAAAPVRALLGEAA